MCTWLEREGKRGANEICSCVLEFLKTQNLSAIEHVKTFSDCCGGQNRNRTRISFMMWACRNFDMKRWEHRFMEPGHSYFPNDSDFDKIGKRKKKYEPIYCKDTHIALIKESQPKAQFKVLDMSVAVSQLLSAQEAGITHEARHRNAFLSKLLYVVYSVFLPLLG
ncbi:hypothetical protein FHG87_002899 [Trinorchestia longiramus]|nr:hypothetical protein FHG87_002899 [Trinorchestia longiramus]